VPHLPLRAAAHVPREGLQRRELCGIAGEGVKEADGSVMVPLQQEDAVDRVEDAVILEKGELDADEGTSREVEEADVWPVWYNL